MKKLKTECIIGKGYELGLKFSKLFSNITGKFGYYEELLKNENTRNDLNIVKEKLKVKYPEYLEETYGRADGLGIDRDVYLLYICFEIRESCTDIIIKVNENKVLIGHNEDLEEGLNEIALVKYINDDGYFTELSTYNCPQGTTFGWNSNGIIYTVNTIELKENNKLGIPVWFILRDIVNSKTVEEVIEKIDVKDCASSFSLNIIDSNKNKAYQIEKVLDKIDVIEINDKYIHTNHIIHENMDKKLSITYDSTINRFLCSSKLIEKVDKKNAKLDDIKYILQYYKNEKEYVFQQKQIEDSSQTVATFLFDSDSKEIEIHSYYDKKVIKTKLGENY